MKHLISTLLLLAASIPAQAQTAEGSGTRALAPASTEGPMAALFDSLIGAPGGAAGGGDPDFFQREFGDAGAGTGGGGTGGGGAAPGSDGGATPGELPELLDPVPEAVSKGSRGDRGGTGRGDPSAGRGGDPSDRGP